MPSFRKVTLLSFVLVACVAALPVQQTSPGSSGPTARALPVPSGLPALANESDMFKDMKNILQVRHEHLPVVGNLPVVGDNLLPRTNGQSPTARALPDVGGYPVPTGLPALVNELNVVKSTKNILPVRHEPHPDVGGDFPMIGDESTLLDGVHNALPDRNLLPRSNGNSLTSRALPDIPMPTGLPALGNEFDIMEGMKDILAVRREPLPAVTTL
ncbi:hypothetical protein K435DRAFT_836409 [Dendrothele bispora CBS 962.96]|uniref:Secreted protein n=1 Tax=Dendrothele bispora (strain CBS 962.96) TaxID=1314807 RepID=A0A4S8MIK0_DENBC|nr:hypothetical protein K435DRAFT_836409 [Dendrothele bispora CBS 962.96]